MEPSGKIYLASRTPYSHPTAADELLIKICGITPVEKTSLNHKKYILNNCNKAGARSS